MSGDTYILGRSNAETSVEDKTDRKPRALRLSVYKNLVSEKGTRYEEEWEELESLGKTIKNISADTIFTKSLKKEEKNTNQTRKVSPDRRM